MTKTLTSTVCFILLFILGCGEPQVYELKDEHLTIYSKIFNEEKPEDVEVVHSFLVGYTPRFMVITSDDYEIELLASRQWVNEKSEKLHLRKVEADDSLHTELFLNRKENRVNDWYVPKDISNYDLYYLYATSIPYVHMLVDKEQVRDDRFRVFVSKH